MVGVSTTAGEEGQQIEDCSVDGGREGSVVVGNGRGLFVVWGGFSFNSLLLPCTELGVLEEVASLFEIRIAELTVEQVWVVLLFGHELPQREFWGLPADTMTPLAVHGDDAEAEFEAVFSLLVAMAHLLHGPQGGHVGGHLAQAGDVDLVVLVADALAAQERVGLVGGVAFQGAHGQHDDVAELGNGTGVEAFHGGGPQGLFQDRGIVFVEVGAGWGWNGVMGGYFGVSLEVEGKRRAVRGKIDVL